MCKTAVKSSPSTNQHPAFYRPDVLPVAQSTASEHWREYYVSTLMSNVKSLSLTSLLHLNVTQVAPSGFPKIQKWTLEATVTYLWVNLHCQEEAEVSMWCETVQLLLQLNKPLGSQVHILQHHPATRLCRWIDSLVGLTEAFCRPCNTKQHRCNQKLRQRIAYTTTRPASVAQWAESQCAPTGTACRRSRGSIPGRPVDFVFGFQERMLWD